MNKVFRLSAFVAGAASGGYAVTLVYVLAHPSRDAATKAWASFRADTEWARCGPHPRRRD
ncbi:MAG: hypothetical protein JWM95_5504 [Gemmatimonadetes bacterium]|nr:hypothetical protein [Gemmatimonadota bacterium]